MTTRSSLLERLREPGDEPAWRRFDALYGEVIVRYARRRGLGLDDAEDIRQIVTLNLLSAMRHFRLERERGRFRSYLGRVVGNAIQRQSSRAYRLHEVLEPDLVRLDAVAAAPVPGLDAMWEEEWRQHHLRRALATVRGTFDARSMAIFERLLCGETTADVAAATGSSVATVHKVRQRVRARLHRLVQQQLAAETAFERAARTLNADRDAEDGSHE
jgi:RNA polymerase sigma-70 factor (ECF subfamily)